jgi:hypothetical protein
MRGFKWSCAKIKRRGKPVKKSGKRNGKRIKFMRLGRKQSKDWNPKSRKLLKRTKMISKRLMNFTRLI